VVVVVHSRVLVAGVSCNVATWLAVGAFYPAVVPPPFLGERYGLALPHHPLLSKKGSQYVAATGYVAQSLAESCVGPNVLSPTC
jgi:hypothetical protein